MIPFLNKTLTANQVKSIENEVKLASKNEQEDLAWENLQPLLKAQKKQQEVAVSLVKLVNEQYLSIEHALEVLSQVFEVHKSNIEMVSRIGEAMECARDIDELNLEPSEHSLFRDVIEALTNGLENDNCQDEEFILHGLATAARMMARQFDSIVENSYRRLIEIDPDYSSYHYSLGLFCKTRGKFREGMIANKKASELVDEPIDSYQWNLGICATGAGEAEIALEVWQRMGNKIKMGRFNLPEGGYPQCKVKLAERPLAERDASNDNPGKEETIWIERLSPCHGIIRSVLYQDLGVNFGDVVLIDGAPVTYHSYGDEKIPVFPHLATLVKNNYSFFDFAATQAEQGQIRGISQALDRDAVVYVHSENYQILCTTCWRDPNINHREHKKEQKRIVTGRIAAPKDMSPEVILAQIDNALNDLADCKIFSPDLCKLAGLIERAEIEKRRFEMLVGN